MSERKGGDARLFEIDDKSSIPIWLQLKNRLVYLIASGHFKAGDRLPTVRGLAAAVEVNYNTVNKVYMSLEQDGYVESRRRQGTFVLDASDRPGVAASSMAKMVTLEYFDRCKELGMALDDIEATFASCMDEARGR